MIRGLMGGVVLNRVARPAAKAIAKRTGLPAPAVSRALQVLLPAALAVITKRAAARKGRGGGHK
ncbi:hypothetical protein [Streptomyces sp.]|uniref:hypothetical protein n=1 Tax=Streptomyces sp. TaxID=1931 RepID=UPI002810D89F|nr:hypothetical protein [Streptomyces sp.]